MSDIRNFEEYRRQVLESLGEDYTVEDLRNEGKWRARVLDALGVDYDTSDTSYFERYRLKVLEGLQGGGGGSSDFSTANVTLINSTDQTIEVAIPYTVEHEGQIYTDSLISIRASETKTLNVVKGTLGAWGTPVTNRVKVGTVSGDVVSSSFDTMLQISGNGTAEIINA